MLKLLHKLKAECPLIGDVRGLGLFATIEFVKDRTDKTPMSTYGRPPEKGSFMPRLAAALRKRRVHAASKWTHLFLAPPLCISEAEMKEGINLIKSAIEEASEHL